MSIAEVIEGFLYFDKIYYFNLKKSIIKMEIDFIKLLLTNIS